MINVNNNKKIDGIVVKAEFIIRMEWDDKSQDDVDLYVMDPSNRLVFFRSRENGLMHLERDDLGDRNDHLVFDGKVLDFSYNIETVTLRGIMSGEYIVNAHMYRKVFNDKPTEVNIILEKINPYKIIASQRLVMTKTGDEFTAFRFVLDGTGDVIDVNHNEKRFTDSPAQFESIPPN
jgi:hypothetical protein